MLHLHLRNWDDGDDDGDNKNSNSSSNSSGDATTSNSNIRKLLFLFGLTKVLTLRLTSILSKWPKPLSSSQQLRLRAPWKAAQASQAGIANKRRRKGKVRVVLAISV